MLKIDTLKNLIILFSSIIICLLILEILCGGLGNNGLGPFRRKQTSHHFTVYNIDAFGDLEEFMEDVDEYLDKLKNSKPAPGFDKVMYAGLPEHEEEKERNHKGYEEC